MNLPNKLTLTRIILVPVFMIFVSLSQYMTPSYNPRWYLIAGIIFAVASFTDYLDGHLARKWHMVTDFGKFADPLADKLLTTVAFLYMMRDGVCSPVVLCIILAREFAVSGLRMVAAGAKDGDRRQHVGQGEDRAPDADHHLLLFQRFPDRECTGSRLCIRCPLAVLAGGSGHGRFRHQVPVGQPQLHQHGKIR